MIPLPDIQLFVTNPMSRNDRNNEKIKKLNNDIEMCTQRIRFMKEYLSGSIKVCEESSEEFDARDLVKRLEEKKYSKLFASSSSLPTYQYLFDIGLRSLTPRSASDRLEEYEEMKKKYLKELDYEQMIDCNELYHDDHGIIHNNRIIISFPSSKKSLVKNQKIYLKGYMDGFKNTIRSSDNVQYINGYDEGKYYRIIDQFESRSVDTWDIVGQLLKKIYYGPQYEPFEQFIAKELNQLSHPGYLHDIYVKKILNVHISDNNICEIVLTMIVPKHSERCIELQKMGKCGFCTDRKNKCDGCTSMKLLVSGGNGHRETRYYHKYCNHCNRSYAYDEG
jgi:hypothetical protein